MRTTTLDEIGRAARSLDRERFVTRYADPLLVIDTPATSGDSDSEIFSTHDGSTGSPMRFSPGPPSPRAVVASLAKRKGANTYANMVTLGRAGNNDVAVEVSSVSKFHAYFTKDDAGSWSVHDAGSSNGTWVDGERLASGNGHATLHDGTSIQLGPDARARFYRPEALFDLLRGTA